MSDWVNETALAVLAGGIIPADERDAGAGYVNAGPRIAAKLRAGVNVPVYRAGFAAAEEMALRDFGACVGNLAPAQVHSLLLNLREVQPGFVKQLRMDVCALYLSDPSVHARIGFPGPSVEHGGYADYDQPQVK